MEVKEVDFGNHGIIYVTQEAERPTITEWPNSATEELLQILKKHYEICEQTEKFGTKRQLYENCSILMRKKGYRYAPTQCENKWKSLKRRYLTTRSRARKNKWRTPLKRQPFDDEIEYLLKYDRPIIRRQLEYDSDEIEEKKYIRTVAQTDEQIVQRMLEGSDYEDQPTVSNENNQNSYPKQKQVAAPAATSTIPNAFLKEVVDLTTTMGSNVEANTNLLNNHNATYEQILVCLDSLDKKADETIEIERKKLEKQGEFLQQKKIMNSLLAKIIQKMGNSFTNNGSK